jgi:photosystem II stability/assembly factor-like uncharacterized protein
MVLAGCEARLDLSGVKAELARPIHRSDLFQAVVRHEDNVMVVGGMGVVLQSQDRGADWQRSTLAGKPFLVDVAACPDGVFHAIEKTAGIWTLQPDSEWLRQELPELTEPQALACDYNDVLWVVAGYSTILHSSDSGASWEEWSLQEDLYLTTIQFIDQNHGVVTGEFGTVLLTDDAGETWTRANDLPDSFYPQSAYFSSPDTGWVVGLSGTIWQTADGAESWQLVQNGFTTPLYGITGIGNTLVAVGDNTSVLYYRMGDAHWTELADTTLSRSYLRGVAALGNDDYIVAGGGALSAITLPGNEGISDE